MSIRNYTNTGQTSTLVAAIGATDTTISLDNYAGDPSPPFTAALARGTATEEVILVTGVNGSTATVTRGYDGTQAQAQGAGSSFQEVVAAIDFREANSHVNATTGVHGLAAGSSVVGTTDTQTLTNKTLTLPTLSSPTITGTATIATASVTGNATVGGTLGVTGATTLTGVLAANGGITVPGGQVVAITDAPAAATSAANKAYVDGLATRASASRQLTAYWGSGTAFPTSGVLPGDTCVRTDLGNTMWRYDGANWYPVGPYRGKGWRTAGFSNLIPVNTSGGYYQLDTYRLMGGWTTTTVAGAQQANALVLPLDGFYRATGVSYITGGGNTCETLTSVTRVRSGVGNAALQHHVDLKTTGADLRSALTCSAPLKAGDAVYLQLDVNSYGSGGAQYYGTTEAYGCSLELEWIAPLNGVTPL